MGRANRFVRQILGGNAVQKLLFSPDNIPKVPASIPGLILWPEYITITAEQELAALIDQQPWDTSWERRRQPYGRAYGKGPRSNRAIPEWGLQLIDRLIRDRVAEQPFNQMLVNEYLPGQGIALHRDYEPFDRTVVSLSLLAPCVMDFRCVADRRREELWLPQRSLLILQDDARYDWEHGIARRKNDRFAGRVVPRTRRLSITFRRTKGDQ
jgi:alkylated DNA repair dioxygenase AlkB